jgi:hypothetical protein
MIVGIGRQNVIILSWRQGGCTVSFLRIHKWEADIYIGFTPALHLQCDVVCYDYFALMHVCQPNFLFEWNRNYLLGPCRDPEDSGFRKL